MTAASAPDVSPVGRRLLGGRPFARLLGATALANLADGTRLAAGPLLAASLTDDPLLIGGVYAVQRAPWLLLAAPVGALVDRMDRRRLLVWSAVVRAMAIALLAGALITGTLSLAAVYALVGLAGCAEVVTETTSTAVTPAIVPRSGLDRANSLLMASYVVGNQLVGPLLGAALFGLGSCVPFVAEAAALGVSAVVATGVHPPRAVGGRVRRAVGGVVADVVSDVVAAVRWVREQPLVRFLALLVGITNVTFAASYVVLVVYARDRLGLGEVGYGLLLAGAALGGVAGAVAAPWLTARLGSSFVLGGGLVLEAAVQGALAVTATTWLAASMVAAFGFHAAVWSIVVTTLRQRAVPGELQGRVGGLFLLVTMGGLTVGGIVGGALAGVAGLSAPFWLGCGVDLLLFALVARCNDRGSRRRSAGTLDSL